jgi:cytochrome P450
VQQLEEKMRALTEQLISGFIGLGGCEFQSQFAQRMPIYTFLTMMQLPLEHAELLLPAAD